jgi:translation initiation factor IF-2
METMRVYEFSRICGVTAKDLLAALREAGFDVSSHMSMLSEKELEFLRNKFSNKEQTSMKKHPDKEKTVVKEKNEFESKNQKKKESTIESQMQKTTQTLENKAEKSKHVVSKAERKIDIESEKKHVSPEGITIEPIILSDFAAKTQKPSSEVILTLLRMGIVATKNQVLTEDIVTRLADHYQLKAIKKAQTHQLLQDIAVGEGELTSRPPVVVVVGHVDHGKTSLLDYIRHTKVAAREKGGITQHLGAYEVKTSQGNVIFLDTPGHEAFSKMRGRGIGVADIAILIVAADDGIMPQTIEAIKFAQEAKLPIIVAVNKMDKVDPSRIDVIRQQLSQYSLLAEEWGGDIVCLPISAKTGMGVDQLLEMISLQAELMELKADASRAGIGYILESKLEKGRGPIATILCKQGTVAIGDYFIAGNTIGKVTSISNYQGKRINKVGPAVPVQVAGFSDLPEVGNLFKVVSYSEYKKFKDTLEDRRAGSQKVVTEGVLNFIIKTDTISTKEALLESIEKIARKVSKDLNIIHAGVGPVSESDVALAGSTGASIVTLHVKPESNAALLARNTGINIDVFDIIYKLLEDLEERIKGKKEIVMVKTKIGQAIVRQVFAIKNVGVVAGCYVSEGRFSKDGTVIVYRRNKEIGSGAIKSLQRDRKTVKEVHAGFECGFIIEGFEGFEIDDRIDCYIEVPADK